MTACRTRPRRQCAKCPWKVGVDPYEIPGGYDVARHRQLDETIAEPGILDLHGILHIMACHETGKGAELPCVGWMHHQLGEGNNIGLRIAVMTGRIDGNIEIVGRQHRSLAATLPRRRRSKAT